MDLEKIEESLKNIKNIKRKLDKIDEENECIELRVFTKGEWTNIDFNPKNKAIRNMVVHQIKMELEDELRQEKINIKKATE